MENQRLFDLVRYKRSELFIEGLLTEAEYSELAEDHTAVARLEDYDAAKARFDSRLKELMEALEKSLRLQSHYAYLLNMHDGGKRIGFNSVEEWLARLAEVERLRAESVGADTGPVG